MRLRCTAADYPDFLSSSGRRGSVLAVATFDEFVAARLASLIRYATGVTCDPHLAQHVLQNVLVGVARSPSALIRACSGRSGAGVAGRARQFRGEAVNVLDLDQGWFMTLIGSGPVSFDDLAKIAYPARPDPAAPGWWG
jgi:hypothetical protein